MIDLKRETGLEISYDAAAKTLIFEGNTIKADIRRLKDMIDVVFDRKWLMKASHEKELYYMFRDIAKEKDREIIEKNNLRYDITIIPPGTLGREYIKTAGHIHPLVPNTIVFESVNGHLSPLSAESVWSDSRRGSVGLNCVKTAEMRFCLGLNSVFQSPSAPPQLSQPNFSDWCSQPESIPNRISLHMIYTHFQFGLDWAQFHLADSKKDI